MMTFRPVLALAVAVIALLTTGVTPAAAAPPTCTTPPVKEVRTDTVATFVTDCGLGSGPAAWSAVIAITDAPHHGSAQVRQTLAGSTLRYLSAPGYAGTDAFSYTVTVAGETSAAVTQAITVDPDANIAPTCGAPSALKVRSGASRSFTLTCSDRDADALTFGVSQTPQHGSASIGGAVPGGRQVTLTADAGYVGADTVSLRADDGRSQSTPATVAVEVIAADANTAPSCFLDFVGPDVTRDRVNDIRTIACQDPEGDDIGVEIVDQPTHGAAVEAGPAPGSFIGRWVAYTPAPGYTGPDSFTVRGRDTRGAVSGTFTVSFTVGEPQSRLFCAPAALVTIRSGGSRRIGGVCSGSDPSGYEIVAAPQHGTVVKSQGFVYTSNAGYTGPDSFSYRLLSASGAGPTVVQPITVVSGANTPPSCSVGLPGRGVIPPPGDIVVRAGTEAAIQVSCNDQDGDPVSLTGPSALHGTVLDFVPKAPGLFEVFSAAGRYGPDAGYTGFDTLTVTGSDGRGGTSTSTADVIVRAPSYNSAPSCASGGGAFPAVLIAGTEAQYDEFCADAEGDAIALDLVTPPQHVTFSPADGAGRVAPNAVVRAPAGYTGSDSLEMQPVDERGGRGGLYGRTFQIIADPGPFDADAGRGDTVGAGQFELPTPARPANARLTTLNEGRITITPANGTAPDGWAAFGLSFAVTAPDAIPEAPLRLRFRFDGSLRAAGESAEAITVFRNSVPVGPCVGDGATPDPCVSARSELPGGDLEIVVLSSRASTWAFGRGSGPQPPGAPPSPPVGDPGPDPAPQPPVAPPVVPPQDFGGGGGGGGSVLQPPVLKLRAAKLRTALTRGIGVTVSSPFAGTARARLTLDGRTAKRLKLSKGKAVTVATGSKRVLAGRRATVTAKFTKRARRALAKTKRLRLTLRVAVGDGPPATRTITLKR